jgi:hypothetical protein
MTTQELLSYLAERKAQRLERFEHMLVNGWPEVTKIETPVYLGSYSWTVPAWRQRWLYQPTVVDLGFGPQSPTEIVRDYLDWKYPEKLRATRAQRDAICAKRAWPAMARRCHLDDAVYVDLKSAYWSIMCVLGWDVDYYPGKWLGVRSSVMDFPLPDHKPARSALVTAGLSSPIRWWDGYGLRWKHANSNHINYGIYAVIMDILHGVASEMIDAGAVYVHTDGYILPSDRVGDALSIASSWGLRADVKAAGPADIWGVGVYRVGAHKTKRTKAVPIVDHFYVEPQNRSWLKNKVYWWASQGTPISS